MTWRNLTFSAAVATIGFAAGMAATFWLLVQFNPYS